MRFIKVAALACVAEAKECPEGSYRSAPIVFGCSGGFGEEKLSIAANTTSAPLNIPLGAEGFRASATSSAGPLSLRLRDEANNVLVASQDHGLVNHTTRAGVYKDVGIVMSKSAELSKDNVSLYLLGALTSPMQLKFRNLAENSSAIVTVAYTFERVLECKFPPEGCSEYNKADARWQVEVWSHWASSHYNATEAWVALAEPHAQPKGVPWSSWPEVWASFIGNTTEAGEEWQPGFSYLDASGDGFVSRDEFEAGFAISKARASQGGGGDIVSDAAEVLRGDSWVYVAYALCALVAMGLLLCLYWRACKPKREGVARSVSQLSRDVKVRKRAGAMLESAPPREPPGPPPVEKVAGMEAFGNQNMPTGKSGAGLWLFPQIGQGFGLPLWNQESFRYSRIAVEEHPVDTQLPAVGSFSMQAPARPDSFSGTTSLTPQLGSFSVPLAGPLRPSQPWAHQEEWARLDGSPFQVQLPQADPFNQVPSFTGSLSAQMQAAAPTAVPTVDTMAKTLATPAAPGRSPGVLQAELAGPVQVESPAAQDGWDRVAAVISPALRAEITP